MRKCLLLFALVCGFCTLQAQGPKAKTLIVSKGELRMTVLDAVGNVLHRFPIAYGMQPGQKKEAGDNRTPEGVFRITSIENASYWTYDFGDGSVAGAYGPWFLRLDTPGFKGIGIHGTHNASTVSGRATHGCIRLKNSDLQILKPLVGVGTMVIIVPGQEDMMVTLREKQSEWPNKVFVY